MIVFDLMRVVHFYEGSEMDTFSIQDRILAKVWDLHSQKYNQGFLGVILNYTLMAKGP